MHASSVAAVGRLDADVPFVIMIVNDNELPVSSRVGELFIAMKRCCSAHLVTRDSHLAPMFAEYCPSLAA